MESEFNNAFNDCLTLTAEAGLFSAPHDTPDDVMTQIDNTAMARAVRSNQPDLVKFLHSTGTVSNRELFQLSRDAQLVATCAGDVNAHAPPSDNFPS